MTNRNIIFTAPRIAEIIERDIPEVKRGTVLVRSVRDTISPGTERANLIGDPNINSSQPGSVNFPRHLGYSISGVVEAVGEGVTQVKVGDRVSCAWTKHAHYNLMRETGETYIIKTDVMMQVKDFIGEKPIFHVVENSIDIDTIEDFKKAEELL